MSNTNNANGNTIANKLSYGTASVDELRDAAKRSIDDLYSGVRLANFWYLFDIATSDMRQAYLPLHQIIEGTSTDFEFRFEDM